VDESSPSALRSRSFSSPRVILTSPNAVPNAVRHGRQSVQEAVAIVIDPHARCSQRYAPVVVRKLKYRSNHEKADQCIVVIATVK